MTEELYTKAIECKSEIEALKGMLERDIRCIQTISTYNYNNIDTNYYILNCPITKELSGELLEVIKNRLNRLEEEFRNL